MDHPLLNNISLGIAILCGLGAIAILPRVLLKWEVVREQYNGIPWSLARQMIRYGKKSRMQWLIQMTVLGVPFAVVCIVRRLLHDDPWQFSAMSVAALAFALLKSCEFAVPP